MSSERLNVVFEALPDEVTASFRKAFPHMDTPMKTNPGGLIMPASFQKIAESIFNFPVDEKDVWVVTYPKSGTTWTEEQVWLLANDADFQGAKEDLSKRFPFLELKGLPSEEALKMAAKRAKTDGKASVRTPDDIAKIPPPRFINTHLPFYLLPPKLLDTCKVVYVARNPKDVCVSWYYHHKLVTFQDTNISFEEFVDFFLNDQLMYSPYWSHVKTAWKMRNHPNLLFLFYEDMKSDLVGQLKKIAAFIGKEYTDETYMQLKNHLVVDNFKKNPSVNGEQNKKSGIFKEKGEFVRKGKTGNWKDHFTPDINQKFDEWIEMNSRDTDLTFNYVLHAQD